MTDTSRPRRPRQLLYDSELPASLPGTGANVRYGRSDGELSKIELQFCYRWTSCYRGSRAAMEAGYNPASAHFKARQLLAEPRIQRQIAVIEADRLRRLRFDGDTFMAQELLLAGADVASELQELWIPPCRYCWGANNEYQRTHAEFLEDFETWMRLPEKRRRMQPTSVRLTYSEVLAYDEFEQRKLPFDQKGGDGYDVEQPPNPACPNCRGRGFEVPGYGSVPHVKLRDTRELSPVGRLLFAGAEHGPKGVKVLVRNQDAARSRLMSMLSKFMELRAAGAVAGVTAPNFSVGLISSVADLLTDDPRSLSDQQLDALLTASGLVTDGEAGEGEAGGADPGEAPPPGYVA